MTVTIKGFTWMVLGTAWAWSRRGSANRAGLRRRPHPIVKCGSSRSGRAARRYHAGIAAGGAGRVAHLDQTGCGAGTPRPAPAGPLQNPPPSIEWNWARQP